MLFLWRGLSFGLWSQSSLNWVKQVARKMIPLPRTGKFSLECYDSSAHRPTSRACFFLYPNQTGVHTRQYGLGWGFAPAWTLDSGLKACGCSLWVFARPSFRRLGFLSLALALFRAWGGLVSFSGGYIFISKSLAFLSAQYQF